MFRLLTLCLMIVVAPLAITGTCGAQDGEADAPAPQPTKEQAHTDALAIQDLYKQHAEAFEGVYGGESVGETTLAGTLKLCEEHLPKLEALEQDALPEIQPVLARAMELWSKPGAEEAARAEEDFDEAEFAFQQSGDIEWNMKMAAADNDVAAARELPDEFDGLSTRYSDLARMVNNVRKTRAANANYLSNYVKNQPEITFFVQEKRVGIMTEWRTVLQWALKFDQANEYANTRLATIDAEIAALQKAVEAEMDAAKWTGQVGDFPGPGAVAGLSQTALEFFRDHEAWGGQSGVEVLAVAIRGPWQVAETDLFGRVISWRLPIHLAVTKPDLKGKNIARVYELSVLTAEGTPGRVAKAPPFDGYWVGDSWMMRLNKVPR